MWTWMQIQMPKQQKEPWITLSNHSTRSRHRCQCPRQSAFTAMLLCSLLILIQPMLHCAKAEAEPNRGNSNNGHANGHGHNEDHFHHYERYGHGHGRAIALHAHEDGHHDEQLHNDRVSVDAVVGVGGGNSNLVLPGNCRLPIGWKGKWFQSGFSSPITIDDKSIGHKGLCLESSGTDKFLFYHAPTNCHKCVVIIEHHVNVLQYKETKYCEEKDILDHLCSQIPGDAPLYSLFRMDAQPIECPFKGAPFTFTYNRGHGECRHPVSNVDTCNDNSRLLLRFQACPDVRKTESSVEELECLATWKEGSNHYLIGKLFSHPLLTAHENEERYRCFVFEAVKNHSAELDSKGHAPTIGYKVAQSGDASCTGVTSTDTGSRALTFNIANHAPVPKCKFPQWVGAHSWHTLDSKLSVKLHSHASVLHIQEENKKNNTLYSNYGAYTTSDAYFGGKGKTAPPLIASGARIICQHSTEASGHHVTITAQQKEGCKSEMVCLNIYKRHGHVIELKIQKQSAFENNDCSKKLFQPDESQVQAPFITLISSSAHPMRCPNLGKYMASGISQDGRVLRDACSSGGGTGGGVSVVNEGAFNSLVMGCNDKGTMEFHSKCSSDEPITAYTCHGGWEESGTKFLIASPTSRSSSAAKRYCFIYTQNGGSLRVSSSSESCRRNISPGIGGSWAFNLTSDGHCAERLTSAAAHDPKSKLCAFSFVIIYAIFLVMISKTQVLVDKR